MNGVINNVLIIYEGQSECVKVYSKYSGSSYITLRLFTGALIDCAALLFFGMLGEFDGSGDTATLANEYVIGATGIQRFSSADHQIVIGTGKLNNSSNGGYYFPGRTLLNNTSSGKYADFNMFSEILNDKTEIGVWYFTGQKELYWSSGKTFKLNYRCVCQKTGDTPSLVITPHNT